ncbi:hypothetical protein MtrunA17_Chr7g0242921 [Medicago truncatula]|uniref:Uncharacterized protein n=1 Tax=Medicago truncatula TaxID=3880 RepID=A0A396H457_MEDTR|nr:hypothetical protein MtrunA17_Chr7g0242921 [Medicago truncatula]
MFISGPLKTSEDPNAVSPGRRLVVPLQICVLQGLSFVKAQLLSMEFPAHVSENLPKLDDVNNSSNGGHVNSESKMDRLVKIDPFKGSWGLRFLELELSNPTDVVFEINVSVKLENNSNEDNHLADQMLQNTAILKQELIEIAQQGFLCILSILNYPFLMIPFYRRILIQMGLVEEEIHHSLKRAAKPNSMLASRTLYLGLRFNGTRDAIALES